MSTSDGLGGSPGRNQMSHLRSRKPIKYGASGEAAIANLVKGQRLRAAAAKAIRSKQRVMTRHGGGDGLPTDGPVMTRTNFRGR